MFCRGRTFVRSWTVRYEPNVFCRWHLVLRCHPYVRACLLIMVIPFSSILPGFLAFQREWNLAPVSFRLVLCVQHEASSMTGSRMATCQERHPLYYYPPRWLPLLHPLLSRLRGVSLSPLFSRLYGSVAVLCSAAKRGGPFPHALRRSRRPHRFYYVRLLPPLYPRWRADLSLARRCSATPYFLMSNLILVCVRSGGSHVEYIRSAPT